MNKMLRKIYQSTTKASDDNTRSLIVTISTDTPDRSGDIVVPKGGDLDNFKKNPVVLYAHDYSGLPVARCEDIEVNDHSITAKVVFPEKGVYELADIVFEMYKAGFLSAWSIGFISKQSEDVDEDEDDSYWFSPQRFTQWEMLEFSAVPVPANPEALTQVRTLGFSDDIVKTAWKELKKKKTVKKEEVKEEDKEEEKPVEVMPEVPAVETPDEKQTPEFEVKRIDETHVSLTGKDIDIVIDLKSGRSLSAQNEAHLTQSMTHIKAVLDSISVQDDDMADGDKTIDSSFIKKLQKELRVQDKSIGLTLRLLKTIEGESGGEK